jgi:WXG100 family type VII secretion target
MAGPDAYSVSPDELDSVIADLGALERPLEAATNDLERQIAKWHEQWEGMSAAAQREAHQEWEQGMTAMRVALAEMRQAARTAHTNDTHAVNANVTMWQGLQ